MLYDPKWKPKTETADPFSLTTLIAWLERQNPKREYDYIDPFNCLMCQYFSAHGYRMVSISSNDMDHAGGHAKFPGIFAEISHGLAGTSWTFGAALKRARKQLALSTDMGK